MGLINTQAAAERLGVSRRRVRQLIEEKKLPAITMGRDWIINESDLKLVENRKPGRPRKQEKAA